MIPLTYVELNPTELCNRKCYFCPRAHGYPNRNLHMTPEVAEQAFAQTAKYTNRVTITGKGEPLLAKYLYEILELSIKYKTRYTMATNGDTLDDHIDEINKIWDLSKPHDTEGWPKMQLNCYDGIDQMEERKKKYAGLNGIHITADRTDTYENTLHRLSKNQLHNRAGYLPWTNVEALSKPCYVLFWKTFIEYNGDVILCCNDWTVPPKSFGNILVEGFETIWENNLHKIRMGLTKKNGRSKFNSCIECDVISDEKKSTQQYLNWRTNESVYN